MKQSLPTHEQYLEAVNKWKESIKNSPYRNYYCRHLDVWELKELDKRNHKHLLQLNPYSDLSFGI